MIVASRQNSQMICRQVPHGGVSVSVSATIEHFPLVGLHRRADEEIGKRRH